MGDKAPHTLHKSIIFVYHLDVFLHISWLEFTNIIHACILHL